MNYQVWNFKFIELIDQVLLKISKQIFGNQQYGAIHFFDYFQRFFYPFLAQFTRIVNAGSINENNRTDAEYLHWFAYRIGGGAGFVGNDGNILPGQLIDKRTFPRVSTTKNTDKSPPAPWRGSKMPPNPLKGELRVFIYVMQFIHLDYSNLFPPLGG